MDTTKLESLIEKEHHNIAGLVVLKNGTVQYEHYFNDATADSHIHVFSVTKSIVSMLIGIALEQGKIKSMDQKVLDFFPEYKVPLREKTIQTITLRNLMSMTAPYRFSEKAAPYARFFMSHDWVNATLKYLGGKDPVGTFRYMPLIGPDLLTGILTRATGQSVLEYAKENLFTPLGIDVPGNITFKSAREQFAFYDSKDTPGWVADPKGINTGGWGLSLTSTDLAKLGELWRNMGVYEGQQLIPASYVADCGVEHSRWEEMSLSYGYLWWVLSDHETAAMGDGGNALYINRESGLVIAITAFNDKNPADRIALIKEYLEPMFE